MTSRKAYHVSTVASTCPVVSTTDVCSKVKGVLISPSFYSHISILDLIHFDKHVFFNLDAEWLTTKLLGNQGSDKL